MATTFGWSRTTRAKRFPAYLLGPAKSWYRTMFDEEEEPTWDTLKKAFLAEFKPPNYDSMLLTQLSTTNQLYGESAHFYLLKMKELCKRQNPDMGERDKLTYMINGFDPKIQQMLSGENIKRKPFKY